MDYESLQKNLKEKFTDSIESTDSTADVFTIICTESAAYSVIKWLKEENGFRFLTDLCGIHFPEKEKEFGVIYHLYNMTENARIRLKTFVTRAHPVLPSLCDLYSGANWMERETFDFYGIEFAGHPDLKRILNVEYMDYYPLRKEYPLEDATREDKDDRFFGR